MTSIIVKPNLLEAEHFLRCLDPEGTYCFCCIPYPKDDKKPIIHEFGSWGQQKNRLQDYHKKGYGIYTTINKTLSKRRKAQDIVAIRAVFWDSDEADPQPVHDTNIKPHLLTETSPGRYQFLWLVSDCELDQFTPLQAALSAKFGGDDGVSDLPRCCRMPGFVNIKRKVLAKLVQINPDLPKYTVAELVSGLGLDVGATKAKKKSNAKEIEKLADVEEGGRNKYLFKIGMKLKNGLVDEQAALEIIYASLLAINEKLPQPPNNPVDEKEIQGIVDSIAKRTMTRVKQVFGCLTDKHNATYWQDDASGYWATVTKDDHREIVRIESLDWRNLIMAISFGENGKELLGKHIKECDDMAKNRCANSKGKRNLYRRLAAFEDKFYHDLCNDRWEVIEITREAVRVKQLEEPIFQRDNHNLPLPNPEKADGSIEKFLDLLRITDEEDRILVKVWLICALIENIPRPPLAVVGDGGSGKTTTGKTLKKLLDPHIVDAAEPPKDDRDLTSVFLANSIPCFDNAETITKQQVAIYNRAVSGGGKTERELYTNFGSVSVRFQKTFIVNSITPTNTQNDFWERTIILKTTTPEDRKDEHELNKKIEQLIPGVLYWMYDSLSAAMRERPTVQANNLARMADWYKWGCAVMKALGIPQDKFETAYMNNKLKTSQDIVLNKPFFEALETLLKQAIPQKTTDSEHIYEWPIDDFKREMSKIAEDMGCLNDKYWPSKNKYADQLKNNVPALQSTGITINLDIKKKNNGKSERLWQFKKLIDPEDNIIESPPQNVLPFGKQPTQKHTASDCIIDSECKFDHGNDGCSFDPTDPTPTGQRKSCPKHHDGSTNRVMDF